MRGMALYFECVEWIGSVCRCRGIILLFADKFRKVLRDDSHQGLACFHNLLVTGLRLYNGIVQLDEFTLRFTQRVSEGLDALLHSGHLLSKRLYFRRLAGDFCLNFLFPFVELLNSIIQRGRNLHYKIRKGNFTMV